MSNEHPSSLATLRTMPFTFNLFQLQLVSLITIQFGGHNTIIDQSITTSSTVGGASASTTETQPPRPSPTHHHLAEAVCSSNRTLGIFIQACRPNVNRLSFSNFNFCEPWWAKMSTDHRFAIRAHLYQKIDNARRPMSDHGSINHCSTSSPIMLGLLRRVLRPAS